MQGPNRSIDFRRVIAALLDNENPFPAAYLRQFSDIENVDLDQLRDAWPQVDSERRLQLLETLTAVTEADTLVCFDAFSQFALTDPDPRVRTQAIRLLKECEDYRMAEPFIGIMRHDEDPAARAAAAEALGLFEYLGELEEIPDHVSGEVEESLLSVMEGSDLPGVRRKALESLGYSGNERVAPFIKDAFESGEEDWMASALIAMGRSLDARWEPEVLLSMRSLVPELKLQAVRSAGMLELASARQPLLEMLEDPDVLPEDIRRASIWSLSLIGGEDVGAALEYLLGMAEDEDEIEFLEYALENLEFTEGFPVFDLMDFEDDTASYLDEDGAGQGSEEEDDKDDL